MSIKLFVTHGRGLDGFAQEEIQEKIKNASNVESLGEGKTSFTILQKNGEAQKERDESKEILNEVSSVFNLKLVERIFILLHCEKFIVDEVACGNEMNEGSTLKHEDKIHHKNTVLQEYTDKLLNVIDNEKWLKVACQVRALRLFQEKSREQVRCLNQSTCPASLRHRAETQNLQEKRILRTEHSSGKRVKTGMLAKTSELNSGNIHNKEDQCLINPHFFRNQERTPQNMLADALIERDGTDMDTAVTHSKEFSNTSIEKRYEMPMRSLPDTKTQDMLAGKNSLSNMNRNCAIANDIANSDALPDNITCKNVITFRVSSRISGNHKKLLTQQWIAQTFVKSLTEKMKEWTTDWRKPLMDFYINITNSHFIVCHYQRSHYLFDHTYRTLR